MDQNSDVVPIGQNYQCELIYKEKWLYNPLNIISITIKEYVYELLPKIELVLKYDPSIFEIDPIEDNDIFTVHIAKSSNDPNMLKMDFTVQDYRVSVIGDDRALAIQITGIFKVDDMFILKNKSFYKKTSLDVCTDVILGMGKNIKIGTDASIQIGNNTIQPNDKMTWYQLNQSNNDFLKHVLKRSNVYDDVVFLYADDSGDFIYTTLNKEMSKKDAKICKFSIEGFSLDAKDQDDGDDTVWYNSYEVINLQGSFNKESNYGVKSDYYDLKINNSVTYNSFKKLTDLTFIDKKYIDKQNSSKNAVFNMYGGTFNNLNMYSEKYFESIVRNYFLRNNFLGLSVELNVNALSKVSLFDKLNIGFNSKLAEGFDIVNSGEYLVTGIVHFISMNGIYQKRLLVSRNGINKPDNKGFIPRNS